jgi:N6-L-threonylcarbamoyladenine synthase
VVEVLVAKTLRAAQKYQVKTVILGGGVAANHRLRHELGQAINDNLPTTTYNLPPLQYSTDNAAMIAAAGYFQALQKDFTSWRNLEIDPQMTLA